MSELIRLEDALTICSAYCPDDDGSCSKAGHDLREMLDELESLPTIHTRQRQGRWIECDYKTLEHGEIESAYKAGLCCSECRTGFKKNHMTYKAFCPNCGADMREGGSDNDT